MECKECCKCNRLLITTPNDGSKQTKTSWTCKDCMKKHVEEKIKKLGLSEGEYYIYKFSIIKKKFTLKDSCKLYYYRCKYCGELKTNKLNHRKYCSKECYHLDTESERKDYYKKYTEENKILAPILNFNCLLCNKPFTSNNPNKKYCSNECRLEKIRRDRPSIAKPSKLCITCGNVSGRKKYCSNKCIPKKPKKIRKMLDQTCKVCGKEFKTVSATKTTCSTYCYVRNPEYRERVNAKGREQRKNNKNFIRIKGKTNIREKIRKRNRKCGEHTLKGIPLDGFIEFEKLRKPGQEIDHIIPLHGELVSGLNVPWNLQLLTCSANNFKSNKFDGTYENKSWINEYKKRKVGN